jgi:hypothetical protein
MAKVGDCLPNKCEALSSNSGTKKTKQKTTHFPSFSSQRHECCIFCKNRREAQKVF